MPGSTWVADVLRFWFEETPAEKRFQKDEAFDADLGARFRGTHAHVVSLALTDCLRDADTALAAVIVLDQFSRNMFRGTPAAFANDPQAFGIAAEAPTLAIDVGEWVERKLKAIECHQSQLGDHHPFAQLNPKDARRLLGTEHCHRADVPTTSAAILEQLCISKP